MQTSAPKSIYMSVTIQAGDYLKSNSLCKQSDKQLHSKLSNGAKGRPRSTVNHLARSTSNASTATAINGSVENSHCSELHINHNSNPYRASRLMMSDDAADAMFSIGSIVAVETGWDHNFEGEFVRERMQKENKTVYQNNWLIQ